MSPFPSVRKIIHREIYLIQNLPQVYEVLYSRYLKRSSNTPLNLLLSHIVPWYICTSLYKVKFQTIRTIWLHFQVQKIAANSPHTQRDLYLHKVWCLINWEYNLCKKLPCLHISQSSWHNQKVQSTGRFCLQPTWFSEPGHERMQQNIIAHINSIIMKFKRGHVREQLRSTYCQSHDS